MIGVADELLDDAAEGFELSADEVMVRRQERAHVLGIEPLGACREADEVDEDDGENPPLVPLSVASRLQGVAARIAETCVVRVLPAAARARDHALSVERSRSNVAAWKGNAIGRRLVTRRKATGGG